MPVVNDETKLESIIFKGEAADVTLSGFEGAVKIVVRDSILHICRGNVELMKFEHVPLPDSEVRRVCITLPLEQEYRVVHSTHEEESDTISEGADLPGRRIRYRKRDKST